MTLIHSKPVDPSDSDGLPNDVNEDNCVNDDIDLLSISGSEGTVR